MQDKSQIHVVIIGAGPAGIAAAVCLRDNGIAFTLLEVGATPLASLQRIDPEMELLSPTQFNRLPFMESEARTSAYECFREYISLLDRYIRHHHLEIRTNTRVTNVSKANNGFAVRTSGDEIIYATHVINATGIIHSPLLPSNFDPGDVSFHWKHSIDVRAHDLKELRNLLIIGGGASAADVLDTWLKVRRPDSHAMLSLRTKLKAFSNPILGLDIHYWIWLHEHLPASLLGMRAYTLPEYMNGTHVLPAIKRGLIFCAADVAEYNEDSIVLKSREALKPDLVVFATGFKYSTEHLKELLEYNTEGHPLVRNCESTKTKNVFLLGLKFGRTFASPYIRGIARDAKYVTRRIARQ